MLKDDLKKKFPLHKIEYKPQRDCAACKGIGEYLNKLGTTTLCVCTCVDLDGVGGMLQRMVVKERKALDAELEAHDAK